LAVDGEQERTQFEKSGANTTSSRVRVYRVTQKQVTKVTKLKGKLYNPVHLYENKEKIVKISQMRMPDSPMTLDKE
jgi:hypothetical protein